MTDRWHFSLGNSRKANLEFVKIYEGDCGLMEFRAGRVEQFSY
jgi:hypothetical protein